VVDSSPGQINKSKQSPTESESNQDSKSFSTLRERRKQAIIRNSHLQLQRQNVRCFYDDFGFATIPLVYGTKNQPKIKWTRYQDIWPAPEEINEWFFATDEPVNVAVVLGPVSNNLIVIDIDGPTAQHIFSKALAQLGYANNLRVSLLHTFVTRSGSHRGYHYLFRISQELLDDGQDGQFFRDLLFGKAKTKLWHGSGEHAEIAMLSKGAMAVVSPSFHPDGGWYALNTKPPEVLSTKKQIEELFAMFGKDLAKEKLEWRREQKRKRKRKLESMNAGTATELGDFGLSAEEEDDEDEDEQEEPISGLVTEGTRELTEEQEQAFLDWLLPIYKKGDRNHSVMGVSGILLKDGYSLDCALCFVKHLCDITNDEEVESRLETVRHTYRKTNLDNVAGWSVFDED
jgi:hypothetical protein